MPIGREDVLSAIRESELLDDVSGLRDDVKLTEQGIDSLGMFSVLLVLSERHGIEMQVARVETQTSPSWQWGSWVGRS